MPAPRRVSALLVSLMVVAASIATTFPAGLVAAVVAWPPSIGLVVAEVMTGGASASDEYIEIANAGSAAADLGGLEIVYVAASGATITRKAAFTAPLAIPPGGHLLVANAAGIYAPLADATYSGGLAADGGAVALRRADGTVIDAVGWGTAANAFVEGSPAAAPPARSSIERLPGGSAGNTQDTNDNRSDWFVQPNPVPQSLGSASGPGPSAAPSGGTAPATAPEPSANEPSATPSATPDPTETAVATPSATAAPTSPPSPTSSPPLGSPAISGSPASAAPSATPSGTATPSAAPSSSMSAGASPSPHASLAEPATDVETIATARAESAGARVRVAGVVTVGPGLLGADNLLAMQDSSGGIFVRLAGPVGELPVGRSVEVEGMLAAPYGQLEIRELDWLTVGSDDQEPAAARMELDQIGEGAEGRLVNVRGTVDSIQAEAGRLTITIGDGTSAVRLLADPPAGISRSDVSRGDVVLATGIVGQHATATGRLDGYRVWLRRPADLVVRAPIPTDPPDPTARPATIRSSTSASSGSGNVGSSPAPASRRVSISSLSEHLDQEVTVAGLVTETAGGTATIDDGTGTVRVGGSSAADALALLEPGDAIEATGPVRQDYQGLIVDADPASIVDLPGMAKAAPAAETPTDDPTDVAPAPSQSEAGSPAAEASLRMAPSPAAPPDGAALGAVLLTALAAVAAGLALARHSRRLRRPRLPERLRRPLLGRGTGR
jgi:hypothetical protein